MALNRDQYAKDGAFVWYKAMNALLPGMRKSDPRLAGGLHRPLQMAIMSLDRALRDCARSKGSTQKGFPRFRKKGERRDSFQIAGSDVKDRHIERDGAGAVAALRLPGLGRVRVRGLRLPECSKRWRFTVREAAPRPNGRAVWSISVNFDAPAPAFAPIGSVDENGLPVAAMPVGIDLGLTTLVTLSTGETIPALRQRPKLLKRQRRLNRQRDRQQKGSVNRKRTVARLARLHEKTANRRKDHLHKASQSLVEGHAGVAGERLSAKALMRTRMAGSMGDAGLGEFRRQLAYKAGWAGRPYYEHPTFQRSTGVCPCCDLVGEKLPLSVREWTCKGCGAVHDRDTAAARVILRSAMEVWGAQASETDTVGQALPEPPGGKTRGKRAFAMPRGPGDHPPGSAHGSAANVVNPDGVKSPEGDGALFGG